MPQQRGWRQATGAAAAGVAAAVLAGWQKDCPAPTVHVQNNFLNGSRGTTGPGLAVKHQTLTAWAGVPAVLNLAMVDPSGPNFGQSASLSANVAAAKSGSAKGT